MSRAAAAVLAMTSACFIKPDPPLVTQSGDGGTQGDGKGSGGGDGSTSGTCSVHDDFNMDAMGCGDWAMAPTVMNSVAVRHAGTMLEMVSLGGGVALCSSASPVDIVGGARVQVTSIISDAYSSMTFDVVDTFATTRVGVRIDGKGVNGAAQVVFVAPSTVPSPTLYDSASMVYWQLRREEQILATASISRTDVVLEYSANGTAWTELGRYNAGSIKFTSTTVRLSATFTSASSDVAGFDNLDACN